jgi:hypothetical protein
LNHFLDELDVEDFLVWVGTWKISVFSEEL